MRNQLGAQRVIESQIHHRGAVEASHVALLHVWNQRGWKPECAQILLRFVEGQRLLLPSASLCGIVVIERGDARVAPPRARNENGAVLPARFVEGNVAAPNRQHGVVPFPFHTRHRWKLVGGAVAPRQQRGCHGRLVCANIINHWFVWNVTHAM